MSAEHSYHGDELRDPRPYCYCPGNLVPPRPSACRTAATPPGPAPPEERELVAVLAQQRVGTSGLSVGAPEGYQLKSVVLTTPPGGFPR